jgi:DNA-binding SARP family transcriptional activator
MERQMPGTVEFCMLGPLAVRCGEKMLTVPRGKQRVLLAALLLNANGVVPMSALSEAMWGNEPPPSADMTIRNYVKRLRQVLVAAGPDRISTHPRGYSIRVEPAELDLARFGELLTRAHAAERAGAWHDAYTHAAAALVLWRGAPLADVGSGLLRERAMPRLTEFRLQAVETRIEAELRLGVRAELIAELQQLAADHPLRERLRSQLMLALYRSGRQAEALATYQQAGQVLAAGPGTEPGPELRELHRQMLTGDPALDAPASAAPIVPRELPGTAPDFLGRDAEQRAMTKVLAGSALAGSALAGSALAETGERPAHAGLLYVITGTAGAGKTALALHWAHQVADRFPDGQLYLNLRDYGGDRPVPADDVLGRLLSTLGVAEREIPAGMAARAARYRSLLASRKMLVLLDNAVSADQVRPLLPGSAGCVTVVASRDPLHGLVVRDGARRLDLAPLSLPDAIRLLRTLIGSRVDDNPVAARMLAEQCARLPLALRLAAGVATARPDTGLVDLTIELVERRRQLGLTDTGQSLRAVFDWSCQELDPDAVRGLRLAGRHPDAILDRRALAGLAGGEDLADRVLERLAGAQLIQAVLPGRYDMHDVLREYARDLADPEEDSWRHAHPKMRRREFGYRPAQRPVQRPARRTALAG